MKKILFLVLVVFSINVSNLTAQKDESLDLTNEEFFEQADFIVMGKLIKWNESDVISRRSYDTKGNYNPDDIYTEYKFKIDYVYKSVDNLIKISDTIVVIADRGTIKNRMILDSLSGWYYSDGPAELNKFDYSSIHIFLDGDNFILFLSKTDLPVNSNEKNNYFHCQFLRDRDFARIKFERRSDKSSGLNNLSFDNKYDLYKYMEQFEYLTLPISDPKQMQWELRYDIKSYNKYREERLGIKNTKEYNDSLKNFILEREKQLLQSVKKD